MRWLVVLALTGCLADHTSGAIEIGASDCNTCHADKLAAALSTDLLHPKNQTACSNCHRIKDSGAQDVATQLLDWQPALVDTSPIKHNDSQFLISSGAHRPILCADCHDPMVNKDSSVFTDKNKTVGAPDNVSCAGCHTGAHAIPKMAAVHHDITGYSAINALGGEACRGCHQYGKR